MNQLDLSCYSKKDLPNILVYKGGKTKRVNMWSA